MIFGWDISTSIVGATCLTPEGKFLESRFLDLRKLEDCSLLDKVDESEWFVQEFVTNRTGQGTSVTHYVEDRLGNFASGRTMLQTLMKLAAFNLAFSYMIMKESLKVEGVTGVGVHHIHPSTVKALMKSEGLLIPKGADKKVLTLDFVQRKEPDFKVILNRNDKPQPYCYDMADSYIVARAGFLRSRKAKGG